MDAFNAAPSAKSDRRRKGRKMNSRNQLVMKKVELSLKTERNKNRLSHRRDGRKNTAK